MKKFSLLIALMFIVLTLSSFLAASASGDYVTIQSPVNGDCVDAGSDLKVKIDLGGDTPAFQQIAFRDLTTDEKHIFNEDFSGTSYKISKKMLEDGHDYRVWVATFDSYGEKLAQDIVEFTVGTKVYTCPFRGDYTSKSFADMYWHCLSIGCFKDNDWLRTCWEGGWCLLDVGLDNPLFSAITDMIK